MWLHEDFFFISALEQQQQQKHVFMGKKESKLRIAMEIKEVSFVRSSPFHNEI